MISSPQLPTSVAYTYYGYPHVLKIGLQYPTCNHPLCILCYFCFIALGTGHGIWRGRRHQEDGLRRQTSIGGEFVVLVCSSVFFSRFFFSSACTESETPTLSSGRCNFERSPSCYVACWAKQALDEPITSYACRKACLHQTILTANSSDGYSNLLFHESLS